MASGSISRETMHSIRPAVKDSSRLVTFLDSRFRAAARSPPSANPPAPVTRVSRTMNMILENMNDLLTGKN